MRLFVYIAVSVALLLGATPGWAEELAFRLLPPQSSEQPASPPALAPVLGEPEVLLGDAVIYTANDSILAPASAVTGQGFRLPPQGALVPCSTSNAGADENASRLSNRDDYGVFPEIVVRGQIPDPTPSPFGGGGPGPAPVYGPPTNPNDCGIGDKKGGGFWDRCCENMKNGCKDIFGPMGQMFQKGPDHQPFRSDHAFDFMTSPVSDPFFFMDPRSLTEVKPIFIYQQTRSSNPVFGGGSNYFVGLQGGVALTDRISFKVSELGLVFMEPNPPANNRDFQPNVGPSELHLGPQITIIRNVDTKTLLAAGMTFEIAWGSEKEFQHTGNLAVTPYVSFAQNFLPSKYGSFNFMNTTGWSGGAQRSDFFFSNFHLDYNVLNLNRIFPLVELDWAVYTNSGNQYAVNFEGNDLFNFGGTNVAGFNTATLNIGARYQISNFWSVGLTGGFSLIGGGGQMDGFRLTFDMIFRY